MADGLVGFAVTNSTRPPEEKKSDPKFSRPDFKSGLDFKLSHLIFRHTGSHFQVGVRLTRFVFRFENANNWCRKGADDEGAEGHVLDSAEEHSFAAMGLAGGLTVAAEEGEDGERHHHGHQEGRQSRLGKSRGLLRHVELFCACLLGYPLHRLLLYHPSGVYPSCLPSASLRVPQEEGLHARA